ncbi:MAG: MoxR family ATPase [Gemmatimonadota bacterium]
MAVRPQKDAGSPGPAGDPDAASLVASVQRLRAEIGRRIVGQERAVHEVILCLLAGGHGLLEGVPGLAKTLMVRTLADALHLEFRRVQFTPDLMPGDITGTEVIEEDRASGRRVPRFLQGPVFTHVLLADEINRAPPKTQAALLEAMEEGMVTAGGEDRQLPRPFFVLATQNPIEQEGTYPLPEAQLDRFLLQVSVDYPDADDEVRILRETTGPAQHPVDPVLGADDVLSLQAAVREVPISDDMLEWAARVVRSTRPRTDSGPEEVERWLRWGAGPRAGQALVLCAKANALADGRFHVNPDDLLRVALPVLRHRLLLNFQAEAEAIPVAQVVRAVLEAAPPPSSGL